MLVRTFLINGLILLCLIGTASSQTAESIAPASPIFTGIVVDCSGSQRLQMDRVVGIVKQYVEAMQDDDQAFVVRYIDPARTSVVQEFTKEKSDLNDAAEGLYVEGGQTSLLDAVGYAARYLAKNKPAPDGLSTLIVISSGEDKASGNSVDEILSVLKEQQVRIYAIGLSDLKVSNKILDRLSKDTGGKAFTPRTVADLSNSVLEILRSLRGGATGK